MIGEAVRRTPLSRVRTTWGDAGIRLLERCTDLLVLRTALGLAALATLLYSAPLWQAHRLPPQVPPFGLAPPGWLDTACFVAALAAAALLLLGRWTAPAGIAFAAALGLLALGDQQRWQPEMQMFALCAIALSAASRGGRPGNNALALFRLYVTTVYLYSGLQKLNPSFAQGTGPWLMQPLLGWLRLDGFVGQHSLSLPIAVGMAALEASLAVLLWLPASRRLGVALAMSMHAFLLILLGPLGHDWNAVIWPWNLFMLVAVPTLFWNTRGSFVRPLLGQPVWAALAVLILVYPLGHAAGVVDAYPAHNLYSGFTGSSLTCLPPEEASAVSTTWRAHLYQNSQALPGEAWYCLDDFGWYYNALHIPPYNAYRVQAAAAVAFCDQVRPQLAVLLEGDPPPLLRPNAHVQPGWARAYFGCEAIRRHARGYGLGSTPR